MGGIETTKLISYDSEGWDVQDQDHLMSGECVHYASPMVHSPCDLMVEGVRQFPEVSFKTALILLMSFPS